MDQEIHLFTIFISCRVIILSLCLLFKQCYGKNGTLWLQLLGRMFFFYIKKEIMLLILG